MGEMNVYGVYVPVLLIQALMAYGLFKIVTIGTDKWVVQGWIAWPSLFNLCLYIVLIFIVHALFIMFSI